MAEESNAFQQAVKLTDHDRRIAEMEDDMKIIKPIDYIKAKKINEQEYLSHI